MNENWEYKLIVWATATELQHEGRHPAGTPKTTRRWRSVFQIEEAGKETDERLNYSNYAKDEEAERTSIEELLAEFGADGWELVSETVLDSVVVPRERGWTNVGTPIQVRWVMKRRAQPQAERA